MPDYAGATVSLVQERSIPGRHVGLSLYSPVGLEGSEDVAGHKRRAHALHDALENVDGIEVTDWGATDAPQPQWLVEIRVMLDPPLGVTVSRSEPFATLRRALAETGAADDLVEGVAAFASYLRTLQSAGDLGTFELNLPDGNRVRCEPSSWGAEFTVTSVTHDPVTISDRRTGPISP
jgi:hypothetical protein